MTDDPSSSDSSDSKDSKKVWEEFLISTFDRLASFRDPKQSVSSAVDWVKGMREDVQERMKDEISKRVAQIDWDRLGQKVADHLAKNYRVKAQFEWEPKNSNSSAEEKKASFEQSDEKDSDT